MSTELLSRQNPRRGPRAEQTLLGDLSLTLARVHEFCGNARRTLAMITAAQMQGPVFWISAGWTHERLNPDGMMRFINPGRVTFMTPRRPEDILWTMEEVLRAGAVPLVVADIPALPGLTSVRRMHLAAETGASEGTLRPLGVLLTPGDGGAQGIESRWHMAGAHGVNGVGWSLGRTKARSAPPKTWHVAIRDGKICLGEPAQNTPTDAPLSGPKQASERAGSGGT
jgi:protein ImuA